MRQDCLICQQNNNQSNIAAAVIWQNDSWLLRHHAKPFPLTGWLILQSKQHIRTVADFSDQQAAAFGLLTKAISVTMHDIINIDKVYLIGFSEQVEHMHLHFIPRYRNMPPEFLGWGIADLYRAIAGSSAASATANAQEVNHIIQQLKQRFSQTPPIS